MGNLVNHVQLIGRLGSDVEVKVTGQGRKVSNFRFATNESLKGADGKWKEVTTWHNCVIWGELNSVVTKYGLKGNKFLIQGSINNREYVDNEAVKRIITEIKVDKLVYLGASKNGAEVNTLKSVEEGLPF